MDSTTIAALFVGSAAGAALAFWAHRRLAGASGRPGCASMGAFVLGWLCVLTALLTGGFLALARR